MAQAQKLEERVLLSAAIIDDSDAGFTTIGDWVEFTNNEGAGREENFHYTTALDTGIEVARWSFEDLEDGSYRVSTTWWASINRTTAAHYTLLDDVDGNVLGAADINQRVTPNDFTSENSAWEDLGYVNIVNGKLVIELSNQSNVNQYVIADAVRIERVGNLVEGPQMSVREGSSGIMMETGTVDFGIVLQNTEAVHTFTIYNSGTSNLSIGTITVPTGYALVTSPPSTISAGTSGTFSLRLNTANVGSASGTVSIETNVAGSDPFTFEITGETIARVIDDGQVGYSTTGSWDYFSGIVGHDNDFEYFQYILGGSGSDVARWDFDNLVDGQYRVSTTWWAVDNRTTSAHYTILDGLNGAVLGAANLDQTLSPNDFSDQDTAWEDLGYVNVTGGQLLVELSNLAAANKYVIADAIRIERVGELPQVPRITVQVENTGLVNNTSVYDFGSYQEGETVTRTFTVHNTGATDLDIGTITIPNGFILLSTPPEMLESGESVELVVQLDTATAAQYLGTFAIESNDTTQNPFQFVIRGTVEAEVGSGTNQPEIAVYHLDGIILDGTGSVPFGTVSQDASVSKTFVIKNVGDEELTISNFVVPRGYFLTSPPASTVAAGSQTSFTIQLDTIETGIYSGAVSFTTNDEDESIFNFNLSATVTARVVDNRDSGFSTAGGWEYFSSNVEAGREDDFYYNYQASSSGSGDEFSYWQFDGLSPGRYLISATWWASPNRTTAAQYSVLNEIGGTARLTKSINQIASPNDFVDQGTSWENLGYVDVTDGGIVVQLSNLTAAGTYVIADAVRVERVWDGLTVDIKALDYQAAETPASSTADSASFRISRRGGESVDTPLTVYFTVGGTATAGSDYVISGANYSAIDNYDWEGYYTGTTRKVVIAAGQSSTEIVITALNDNVKEALETAIVTLSNSSEFIVDSNARTATANIADNDQWVASIQATDNSAAELPTGQTANTATFEITRTGESDLTHPLDVYFTVGGTAAVGSDYAISGVNYSAVDNYDWEGYYVSTTRKVTLAAGQTSATLTVTALNDSAKEPLETVTITLSANSYYTANVSARNATANIVDNDQWVASILAVDSSAVELPAGQTANTATFQIIRSEETDLTYPLEVFFTVSGTATVGIDYSISGANYTATDNYDWEGYYLGTTRKVVLAAGQTSTQITITALNDSVKEALETMTVSLSTNASYTLATDAKLATANIGDNDQWVASILAIDNTATEAPTSQTANIATYEITRGGESDLTYPLEIYFTIGGTAAIGSDYTINGANYTAIDNYDWEGYYIGTTRKVILAAGQTSSQITITALNDSAREGQETVTVSLSTNANYTRDSNATTATVNVVDNDMWVANIQATDNTAAELPAGQGVNNATFQIIRSGESDLTYSLDVYFNLSGTAIIGVDYSLSGSTYSSVDHYEDGYYLGSTRKVTIAAGQTSALLTLTAINDSSMESTETATISVLSNTAYATNSGTVNATVNILDDDQWIASVHAIDNSAAEKAASETPESATFQITRNGDGSTIYPLDVYFSIGGTASLGNDYVISGSAYSFVDHYEDGYYLGSTRKVTIPAGQTSVQLTITALNDSAREGLETVTVTLSPNANYARDTNATTATVNVVDNDMWVASIQAIDNTAAETQAGQTANTAVFQIARSGETDLTYPLDVYFSIGGTASLANDYTVSGPTYQVLSIYDDESGNYYPLRRVTIPAGQTSAQLTITALNDNAREGLETVTITLFGDANYGTNSSTISATANIVDNDMWVANIQAIDNTAAETQAGQAANTAVFEVTRSGDTDLTYPLDVYFSIEGTASLANDYTVSGSTYQVLSIYDDESGNYYPLRKVTIPAGQTAARLTITALNDSAREGLETVTITLFGDTNYSVSFYDRSATANIVDNDQWTVSVQAIDSVAGELPSSETPNVGTFQITRTGETDTTHAFDVYLTFAGTASLGVDFTISGANYQANTFYDEESGNYYTVRKVTIPAGQASVQFTITALNDNAKEGLETAIISIQSNPNYTVNSSAASATANIQDNDDQWVISIHAIDGIAQETPSGQPANTAVLEITRSGSTDTTFPLEVRLDFSGIATLGTDYVVTGATYSTFLELNSNEEYVTIRRVIIPSGQLSAQITITAVNDSVNEPTETLVVALNTSAAFTLDNNAKTASVSILANLPPTDISLSANSLNENLPIETVVGSFSAIDPNVEAGFTYSLVSGTGSSDNAQFSISGSQLLAAASFNYEQKNSYSVRVRVTDALGLWYEKVFSVAVTDVNEIVIQLPEDVLPGENFYSLETIASNFDTFTITSIITPASQNAPQLFSINSATNSLVVNEAYTAVIGDYVVNLAATSTADPLQQANFSIIVRVTRPPADYWTVSNLNSVVGSLETQIQNTLTRIENDRLLREQNLLTRQNVIEQTFGDTLTGTHTDFDDDINTAAGTLGGEIVIIVNRRDDEIAGAEETAQDIIDQAESDYEGDSEGLEDEYNTADSEAEDEYDSEKLRIESAWVVAKNAAKATYDGKIAEIESAFNDAVSLSEGALNTRLGQITSAYNSAIAQAQSALTTALTQLRTTYDTAVATATTARDTILNGLATTYSLSAVDSDPVYLAAVASANASLATAIDNAASTYTSSVNSYITTYNSTISTAEQTKAAALAAADAAYDSAVASAETTYTSTVNSAKATFDTAVSTAQQTFDTESARITNHYQTATQQAVTQHNGKLAAAQTRYNTAVASAESLFTTTVQTNFGTPSVAGQYAKDLVKLAGDFLKASMDAAHAKKQALQNAPTERESTITDAVNERTDELLSLNNDYDQAILDLKEQLDQARIDAEGQLRHPDDEPGFIDQYLINGQLTWESYRNASLELASTNGPIFQALGNKMIEMTRKAWTLYEQHVSNHWDEEIKYVEAYANAHKEEVLKIADANRDYDVAIAEAANTYFEQLAEKEAMYVKLLNDAVATREKSIATAKQEFVKSVSSADEEFHKKMATEGKTRTDDFATAEKAYVGAYGTAYKAYQQATSTANTTRSSALTTADTTWVSAVSSAETTYTSTTTQATTTLEVQAAQAYTTAQQAINGALLTASASLSSTWATQFNILYNYDADAVAFAGAWSSFDAAVVSAWTGAINSLNGSIDSYISAAVNAASTHDNNMAGAYEAHAGRVVLAFQQANADTATAAKTHDDSYATSAVTAANEEATAWATKVQAQASAVKSYVNQMVSKAKTVVDKKVDAQTQHAKKVADELLQAIKSAVDEQKKYVKAQHAGMKTRTVDQANNSYDRVELLATEHAQKTIDDFKAKKEAAVLEAKKLGKHNILSAMTSRDSLLNDPERFYAGLAVEQTRTYVIRPFGEEAHLYWWIGNDPINPWGSGGNFFSSFTRHSSTVPMGNEVSDAEYSIYDWSIPGYKEPADGPSDAYTDSFNWLVGEYVVRTLIDDERLAQPGGVGDDLLLVARVVTEGASFVDPTGASDLVNAATYAIGGEWGQVTVAMAGIVAPFGVDKLAKWAGRIPTGVVANGVEKLDEAAGVVNQGASQLDNVADLVDETAETVSQRYTGGFHPLDVIDRDGCFVAGTPVLLSSISESFINTSCSSDLTFLEEGSSANSYIVMEPETALHRPIESVPLGARVPTKNPRTWEADTQVDEPDDSWKKITLTLSKPNGSTTWMEFLRPAEWVARHVSDDGLQLSIPELELKGTAQVHSIEACPEISLGDGSVVTGRYLTYGNIQLTTITLSTAETITGTPIHPIWSVTRRDWVPLGELEEEEELLGMYGPVTVMSVQSQTNNQPVYNLEIHSQHAYQVGNSGIIVHNSDPVAGGGGCLERALQYMSPNELRRIQNAANFHQIEIHLVGSRAGGDKIPRPDSDWDFVIQANHKTRHRASSSLPGAKDIREGLPSNQDIFNEPLNMSRPYLTFTPE